MGVNWVRSLRKNSDGTHGTKFFTSLTHFTVCVVTQPNSPKCTQIVRNARKCEFRVQWVGSGAFIAKNYDATSWHELLHQFCPFCTEFYKATKQSQLHQNSTNCTKTKVQSPMGWIGCVRCEKFQRDFVARTVAPVDPFCTESCRAENGPKCTQQYETHQNMSLGSNGVDRVRSLRKILTRLRGTNFCIRSACFPSRFVSQPNGPKCIKIV